MMKMMLKNWKTGFQKPVFGFQHIPKHESQLGSSPQFFSNKEPKNQNLPKTVNMFWHVFKPIGMCNTLEKLKKWCWTTEKLVFKNRFSGFNMFQPVSTYPKTCQLGSSPQFSTARSHSSSSSSSSSSISEASTKPVPLRTLEEKQRKHPSHDRKVYIYKYL